MPNDRGTVKPNCIPVPILDLGKFKEMIVSFGMHSPFVKQMLGIWSVCNRVISIDWIDSIKVVLELGSQLQWTSWFREEGKTIEQWDKAKGIGIS